MVPYGDGNNEGPVIGVEEVNLASNGLTLCQQYQTHGQRNHEVDVAGKCSCLLWHCLGGPKSRLEAVLLLTSCVDHVDSTTVKAHILIYFDIFSEKDIQTETTYCTCEAFLKSLHRWRASLTSPSSETSATFDFWSTRQVIIRGRHHRCWQYID